MFGFDARAPPARHDKDRRTLYYSSVWAGNFFTSRSDDEDRHPWGARGRCWVASRCILGLPETVDTDPVGGSLERRDGSEPF
jgi:hypothetical protein